jgi:hypothetical protein
MSVRDRAIWRRQGAATGAVAHVAVVLLALVSAGCDVKVGEEGVSVGVSAGRVEDEWTRTYMLPASGRLELVSFNGSVDVRQSDGPGVEVRIVREARASTDQGAREALQRTEIVEDAGPERVLVQVRPVEEGDSGRRARRQGVSVRMDVRVPAGLAISVSTQNGPVHVENVTGRLTVAGSNAPLRATGITGGVSASIVNGGVDLDFASLDDPVELTVVNGGVRIALPESAGATLSGTITNGRLDVAEDFTLSGAPGSDGRLAGQQRLGGSINGGGPALTIQAKNVSVRIVPRGASPDAARGR